MGLTYFKRFRMEIDLRNRGFSDDYLPPHYTLVPWNPSLLEVHAETKFYSFRGELDSNVFPCLGEYTGCVRLMEEIVAKPGFLPGATWLAVYRTDNSPACYCGTVQGVIDRNGMGAIQNLGIIPQFRGRGIGASLMQRSLAGFQRSGLRRAFLEVTAQNTSAVRLYKRLGFSRVRTVYKVSEAQYA